MAKLPGFEDVGGAPSGRSGKPIATADTTSIGRGMAQFGAGVSDLGASLRHTDDRRRAEADERTAFETKRRFLEFKAGQEDRLREMGKQEQPGAFGFRERYQEDYIKSAKKFMTTVPDSLKAEYDVRLFEAEDSFVDGAGTFERERRAGYYETTVSDGLTKIETRLYANPKDYDAALKEGTEFIDALPSADVGPVEKEALKRAWKQKAQLASLNGMPPSERKTALGVAGDAAGYRNAIAAIESAGSGGYAAIGATHPTLGRALGRYQIMEKNIGPWSKEALGRAVSVEEFMANPDIQDAIFDHKFGGYVKRFGPEGAAQAWFAGPGGVGKTDRKDALGTDVGGYGKKFMAALGKEPSGPLDPRFADLPLDVRREAAAQADAAIDRQAREDAARTNAQRSAYKDALSLGIETGSVISDQQILTADIGDGDKATLLKALRTKQKENAGVQELVAAIVTGNSAAASINPFDADRRATGDKAYAAMLDAVPEEQRASVTDGFIQSTGYIPKQVQADLRNGAASTDPATVAMGLAYADRLHQAAPVAFRQFDGSDDVEKKLDLFNVLTRSMGYSEEEAARRIIDQGDPDKARQRNALLGSDAVKKELKKVDATSVSKAVSGLTVLGWKLGENEEQKAAMVEEYRDILTETIVDANGDIAVAKELANKRFTRVYGASELTFANIGMRNVITRLPPEKTYAPLPDGSFDYFGQQLRDALKEQGVEFDDVRVSSFENTDPAFRKGEPVPYRVHYLKNGQWEVFNFAFHANRAWAMEKYEAKERKAITDRRAVMEQKRAEELRRFPHGRDRPEVREMKQLGPAELREHAVKKHLSGSKLMEGEDAL